jgi:catechol 2,3-dioxygenase-like lactoylglutathione lyase family enzyme
MAKAGYFTPTLHVTDIERSIAWYQRLGFRLVDRAGGWARLHCEGGALMFLEAEKTIEPSAQGVTFYMYAPDLAGLREQLIAEGVRVPQIKRPEYMPSGEFYLDDPDGYRVGIGHWGEKEHSEWLKRIGSNT